MSNPEWSSLSSKGAVGKLLFSERFALFRLFHLHTKWGLEWSTGAWPELIWVLMAIWLVGHARQDVRTSISSTDPTASDTQQKQRSKHIRLYTRDQGGKNKKCILKMCKCVFWHIFPCIQTFFLFCNMWFMMFPFILLFFSFMSSLIHSNPDLVCVLSVLTGPHILQIERWDVTELSKTTERQLTSLTEVCMHLSLQRPDSRHVDQSGAMSQLVSREKENNDSCFVSSLPVCGCRTFPCSHSLICNQYPRWLVKLDMNLPSGLQL